ncbi:hypothetical protein [uncultured Maricaulis sp.]|uniref:hypothetical protein n=1 Tax=uncultured Maricaulis sp. TaxID=174710 RepID=UPI0030D87C91
MKPLKMVLTSGQKRVLTIVLIVLVVASSINVWFHLGVFGEYDNVIFGITPILAVIVFWVLGLKPFIDHDSEDDSK